MYIVEKSSEEEKARADAHKAQAAKDKSQALLIGIIAAVVIVAVIILALVLAFNAVTAFFNWISPVLYFIWVILMWVMFFSLFTKWPRFTDEELKMTWRQYYNREYKLSQPVPGAAEYARLQAEYTEAFKLAVGKAIWKDLLFTVVVLGITFACALNPVNQIFPVNMLALFAFASIGRVFVNDVMRWQRFDEKTIDVNHPKNRTWLEKFVTFWIAFIVILGAALYFTGVFLISIGALNDTLNMLSSFFNWLSGMIMPLLK